jgi:hypothetical protein
MFINDVIQILNQAHINLIFSEKTIRWPTVFDPDLSEDETNKVVQSSGIEVSRNPVI